jgi:XTP/dITP diphosphohydrolase
VTLYFVTVNAGKVGELREQYAESGIRVEQVSYQIQEILNVDLDEIVRQKVLAAYRYLDRPCAVEHGGLFVTSLKDLPGGFTKEIWETIGARMCDFLTPEDERSAVARSLVGYCDGRRIHLFRGETAGRLSRQPAGSGGYLWDPIFMPEGSEKTLAEMSAEEKARHSHARKAWSILRESLTAPGGTT